jgi:hypothetical protein
MKVLSVLVLIALSLAVPATASAARFEGRAMGNSHLGSLVPKHTFYGGDVYGLHFRDAEQANTSYRLCAIRKGSFRCVNGRTKAVGKWSIISSHKVVNLRVGRTVWRWSVGGQTVARWETRMYREGD